uniref:UMP-CMP kinase n=1 Tax=Aceria tosichella TaxID=561515 RepID=A0A6G1SI60_9ACAR
MRRLLSIYLSASRRQHPNNNTYSKMATDIFNAVKPAVTFVLGGPGSGKGTQCKLICDEFGFKHLSAGDLLRAERNSPGSQYGEMIEKHIQEGKIVPVEVTCSLLEKAMRDHCQTLASNVKPDELPSKADGGDNNLDQSVQTKLRGKFLIDGFPRNEDNLTGWTKQLGDKAEVKFVLFLDCPHDVCIERCLKRGQQGSNRSDDNEVSLRKRLVTFTQDTMPIVEYYEKLNLLRKIDATKSPSEVYAEVRKLFL